MAHSRKLEAPGAALASKKEIWILGLTRVSHVSRNSFPVPRSTSLKSKRIHMRVKITRAYDPCVWDALPCVSALSYKTHGTSRPLWLRLEAKPHVLINSIETTRSTRWDSERSSANFHRWKRRGGERYVSSHVLQCRIGRNRFLGCSLY